MEDEVIAWCRQLGFKNTDASLSKASIAKLCRGQGGRSLIEFAMRHLKPIEEAKRLREEARKASMKIDDVFLEVKEAKLAKRRATLRAIQAKNEALGKARDRLLAKYQERVNDSVKTIGKNASYEQAKQDKELQLSALRGYRSRWESQVLPLIDELLQTMDTSRFWASRRAQHSLSPPPGLNPKSHEGVSKDLVGLVQRLLSCLELDQESKIESTMGLRLSSLLSHDGSSAPRQKESIDALLGALKDGSPIHILSALTSLSSSSTRTISEALINLNNLKGGGVKQESVDPRALLQELREEHLSRFVALSEQKLAIHQTITHIQALSAKHPNLPEHLRAQVKVSGLKARIEAFRMELSRLEALRLGHQGITLKMQKEIDGVMKRAQGLESLTLLAPRIQSKDLQMMMKWNLASAETGVLINWRHFLGSSLHLSCDSLNSQARTLCSLHPALHPSCTLNIGRAEGEVARWMEEGSGDRLEGCASTHPMGLGCSWQEMPLASYLLLMFFSKGDQTGSRQGRPGHLLPRSVDVPLPVWSLKCPSSLICITAEKMQWIPFHSQWIELVNMEPFFDPTSYAQDQRKVNRVQNDAERVWLASIQQHLPNAQSTLDKILSLKLHLTEGSFKSTLSGLMHLPATTLLPDVKVEGCSAMEWLQAFRETHAMRF